MLWTFTENTREPFFFSMLLDNLHARNYIVCMKTRIVRIGNSQGVRIPKLFLEQTALTDEVELEVRDNQIVIRSSTFPRQDWDEAFSQMAANGDDRLLDNDVQPSRWDEEEWQW